MRSVKLGDPILFFGIPRSGTSVISEIILRHRDLAFPSQYQNQFPVSTAINYLRRIFDNSFWRLHGQKKQLNRVRLLNRYIFRPVEAYAMWNHVIGGDVSFGRNFLYGYSPNEKAIGSARSYFERMVLNQGKIALAFKTTGPSRLDYLMALFPNLRLVRIHREPVPIVSSLLKVEFWKTRGANQLWWQGAWSEQEIKWSQAKQSNSIAMTTLQIAKIHQVTNEEIKKHQLKVLDVHYEEFVDSPVRTIEEILDYCELARDQACFDYLRENRIFRQNREENEYFSPENVELIKSIWDCRFAGCSVADIA